MKNSIIKGNNIGLESTKSNRLEYANTFIAANNIGTVFLIDRGNYINPSFFNFDRRYYNLFVVDSKIESNDSFTVFKDDIFLHSEKILFCNEVSKPTIEKALYFPSIIAHRNETYLTAGRYDTAYLALVHKFEVLPNENRIKFTYAICCEFKQQIMNVYPKMFGFSGLGQQNELDYLHWDIKEIDILQILKQFERK